MIHVIDSVNRHLYGDVLNKMFALRHEIFVEQRGWKRLAKPDGLEMDQFDSDSTIYVLKLDPELNIIGGMRLCPTTGPTQLNTIFKESCVLASQPVGDVHYEWSRYFIKDTKYRSATGKPVFYELYTGILEYAVAKGIQSLSGFIETNTYNQALAMPWDFRQLGIPTEYGGTNGEPIGYGLPTIMYINEKTLRHTKVLWRMRKPVLSLSLGELTTYQEIGFKPETVFAVQKFLSEHPEHIDIIAELAAGLQNIDPYDRSELGSAIAQIETAASSDEFDPVLVDRMTAHEHSLRVQ